MEENILSSIKKLVGLAEDYTEFDLDLLIHINSVFSILKQLGVGPESGLIVTENSKWMDFIEDSNDIEMVRSYVYLKVRMLFDPPTRDSVKNSFQELIKEFESRLNYTSDPKIESEE